MKEARLIKNENWKALSKSLFDSNKAQETAYRTLQNNSNEIHKLYSNFKERTYSEWQLKKHFPKSSNKSYNSLELAKIEPNLIKCICITLYVRESISDYIKDIQRQAVELEKFCKGGNSSDGKSLFHSLTEGRKMKDDEASELILKSVQNLGDELNDYENESEVYENRDIDKFGLTTYDSIKCLEDFEGRTFPFIRSIVHKTENGDLTLDIGSGTGVLSIASLVSGSKRTVGIEVNPITCLLSRLIYDDIAKKGLIDSRNKIRVVWSDALKFGSVEYPEFREDCFDLIISENIYTGMFYELQMRMISRAISNGLVDYKRGIVNGVPNRQLEAKIIPKSMSTAAELVELDGHKADTHSEVLVDIEKPGFEVKKLTEPYPFDIIRYTIEEPSSILSKIRYRAKESGNIDAINIYSIVKLSEDDYILRNENSFLNNDHIIHLDKSIPVQKGDEVILTIAYHDSEPVSNGVFEVRKTSKSGTIPEKYDAKMNIDKREHKINKLKFKDEGNITQEIKWHELGDMEQLRCSSYYKNYKNTWRKNLLF